MQRRPLWRELEQRGVLAHHEVVARTADRPSEHADGDQGGLRDGEGTGEAPCRAGVDASAATADPPTAVAGPTKIGDFGSNPGRLVMFVHVPAIAPAPRGAADRAAARLRPGRDHIRPRRRLDCTRRPAGLPLVLPEQSGENNQGRCFNWFRPEHVGRGRGEALSIRQMVAAAVQRFGSDPNRVYVAGLSAGGAMAAALLAAYPDVFAAGAVVAGLPVGAASGTTEALRRMAEAGPARSPAAWAELVRRAAPGGFSGPWPRLSIWHGEDDRVVDPANARLLAEQWSALHGLAPAATETAEFPRARRDRWNRDQRPAVELWRLSGLSHAWPMDAVRHIAAFWRLPMD